MRSFVLSVATTESRCAVGEIITFTIMWNMFKTASGETVVTQPASENKIGGTFGLILLLIIAIAIIWMVNAYTRTNSENRLADSITNLQGDMGVVKERSIRNESRGDRTEQRLNLVSEDFNYTKGQLEEKTDCNAQEISYLRRSRRVKTAQKFSNCSGDELEVVEVFA